MNDLKYLHHCFKMINLNQFKYVYTNKDSLRETEPFVILWRYVYGMPLL